MGVIFYLNLTQDIHVSVSKEGSGLWNTQASEGVVHRLCAVRDSSETGLYKSEFPAPS